MPRHHSANDLFWHGLHTFYKSSVTLNCDACLIAYVVTADGSKGEGALLNALASSDQKVHLMRKYG